jgi:hypothetical protein
MAVPECTTMRLCMDVLAGVKMRKKTLKLAFSFFGKLDLWVRESRERANRVNPVVPA